MTKGLPFTKIILCVVIAFLTGCATYSPRPLSPSQTASSFEARTLDSLDLKKYLEANLNREIAPWPLVSWDFSMLVMAALYYHPDLDVARAKWGVAQARILTARQHPNPTIGFVPQYDITPGSGIPSPWVLEFRLDIPIETAGKRGYRVAEANHFSEAARLDMAATAWQVRSRLRACLLNLFWAGQSVLALEKQLILQEDLVRLMEKRLAVGEVSQPEVTQARLSVDQAQLSLSDSKKKIAEAQSQTADALGITVNAMNEIKISFVFFEEPAPKLPPADLRRQALLNRPDVLSALAEYAASESALRLEIAKQYPDITIGPAYTFDQGENKWGLGLSLTLPILNQNQGPIAESDARRTESGAVFISLQAKVIGEIDLALAGYEAALRKLARADALVSDNERQQRSTQAVFDVGEADRLALLGAQLELLSSRLSRLDALVQSQRSLGLLEDALQCPLDLSGSLLTVPEKNPRPREER